MTAIPAIATVIPAAGVGKRMKADKPKQYLQLCGVTVLEQTLRRLKQVPALQQFYLALSPDDPYFPTLPLATDSGIQRVDGGAERALCERGASLLAFCRDKLQAVENQIKVLEANELKPWDAA